MPSASATAIATSGNSHPTKTSSKGSIRHSLGFASMGKALADVIGSGTKDSKSSSRRLSVKPSAPDDTSQKLAPRKESPELVKTVTRKRASVQLERPSIDQPKVPHTTVVNNTVGVGLRPRGSGASSALPKYRPKSQLIEKPKEPPSPPRAGTRRRLSSSDDESVDQKPEPNSKDSDMLNVLLDKSSRPVSPLPRKSKKVDLSGAMKVTSSAIPNASKKSDSKASKSAAATLQRPSSVASSASSQTPHTPKSSLRVALGLKSSKTPDGSPNPFRTSRERSESPLAKHARHPSKDSQNLTPKRSTKEPPHHPLSSAHRRATASSSDTDDSSDDVAELLAPVAPSTAPTPAMPRLQSSQNRKRLAPATPTRANPLPARDNLPHNSPLPAGSPSSLRLKPPQKNDSTAARGSLFSWEHMVENSITLEADELGKMLSDTAAPFHPDPMSPTPSVGLEIPDSPCLSAISSPGGYGAISHVRLPDVTPSPAVHANVSKRFNDALSSSTHDATNTIYQLRLQLEAARNTAQERLNTVMRLERELESSKAARAREAEELSKQVAILEVKMVDGIEAQQRSKEAHAALLQCHQQEREQAVMEATLNATKAAERTHTAQLEKFRREVSSERAAHAAALGWNNVIGLARAELDLVKGNRDMLALLHLELNRLETSLS